MTVINHKSISGITSITAPAGSDDLLTVHTNDTSERFRILKSGAIVTGVATASNFKTGTTNVHNVGVEAAGINVLGADTPIGTGATIYNSGAAVFTGIVTATNLTVSNQIGINESNPTGKLTITNTHQGFVDDSAQPQATFLIKHGTSGTDRRWIGIGADTTGAWLQSSSPGGSGLAAPLWINKGGGDVSIGSGGTKLFVKHSSAASVGIGTNVPIGALHLNYNGNNGISFRMENYEGSTTFHNDSGALHIDSGFHLFRNQDGSSEFLRIKSNGDVGIGIASPLARLHTTTAYNKTGAIITGGASGYNNALEVNNANGARVFTVGGGGFIKQKFTSNNSTTAEGLFINNLNNGTGNNASLILSNDSGERKKAAIALIDTGAYGAGDLVFALDGADSGNLHLTNDEKLRITSGGKVNIGGDFTQTSYQLSVTDTGGNLFRIKTANEGDYDLRFMIQNSESNMWHYGTDDFVFGNRYNRKLHFITNAQKRLTINGDNVGINQQDPQVHLDIKATAPQIRLTCSDNNLDQGDTIGQIGWYTTDPTTPGGAGTVSYINTFSANGNGADYSTKIFNRDGSGGGSTFIQLGNALGSIKFGTNTAGNAGIERLLIDSAGRLTLNQCDRTANVKALRIKADNDTTSTASTDRTGSNSYKNSAIVIQKGISNGSLVAGLIDAWDGSIHGTSIGITYSSGRYHTSFGVNNDTNDRPVEIMTISGNKKVKIGGGIASIGADVGLEIGGDGATTEIRLKNSGGGTGASDGFAIQKWSNGNNYIYDYDSNNILFGTGNLSRTSMDTSGRWCFSPGPSLQSASSAFTMSLIHEGNFSSTGIYPGIAMKSTDTGGGDGMVIHAFDGNWDLYTRSGNRDGITISNDAMNAGSGNSRVCIGGDGVITMGKTVYDHLTTSRYCHTALHVSGGAVSIGAVSNYTGAHRAGVYTLGWYTTYHANASYYHIKTDLWAGGSPHGNNEYIMGGFRIEGYSYSSPVGSSTSWIQFHNWNGGYPGLTVKEHYSGWSMGAAVYTSSDGYVVLRLNGGTYKAHVIDLIQHTIYPSRDIGVASFAQNNNSTHF